MWYSLEILGVFRYDAALCGECSGRRVTMQTQDKATASSLALAIAKSQNYLLSLQNPAGYWWAELESNVTITSEVLLLHKIWGTEGERPLHKVETYLRSQQREHGGWELFYGDGGELSTSVEAYMALKLLGVPESDPAMLRAKAFILERGGISRTRIFTKIHLALIGCYSWRGVPSLPPWVMLLPEQFPFNIYEMSSWARSSTVPLLIVLDRKPVFQVNPKITLDELYSEGAENAQFELPRNSDWTDIFLALDNAFKFAENLNIVPFREEGIKAAEKWILERQEVTGDWGGIIPAMLNSLLALRCLDYQAADPIVYRGLKAVDNFAIETEDTYRVQPCVSPVWDTAWAMRALIASMQCQEGGWAAFDLDNNQDWLNQLPYGDLKAMIDPNTADVTARVLEMLGLGNLSMAPAHRERALTYLIREQEAEGCWFGRWGVNYIYGTSGALSALALVAPQSHRRSIERGADWLVGCQNSDGGWGETCRSYDDPTLKGQGKSTASQTAWALIGLMAAGEVTGKFASEAIERGMNYLLATQQPDGTWNESEFTGTGFPRHFYLKYHLYQQCFPLMALGRHQALLTKL